MDVELSLGRSARSQLELRRRAQLAIWADEHRPSPAQPSSGAVGAIGVYEGEIAAASWPLQPSRVGFSVVG